MTKYSDPICPTCETNMLPPFSCRVPLILSAPSAVSQEGTETMGNVNAIPVVSQLISAGQAMVGDMEGALETQEQFSKQCPIVSQVRSAVEAGCGDCDAATRTQLEFVENLERVADSTPALGHIKGGVHYALGQTEKGDECMRAASSATTLKAASHVPS